MNMSNATCQFPGCDRPRAARGLCNTHYVQQRNGKPLTPIRPMTRGLCGFDGCERRRRSANGFCGTHNSQYKQGYELTPIGTTRKKEGATCEICGADISDRRSYAKYCSKTCSQKAYVRNNPGRVKELRADGYLKNKARNQLKRDEAALKAKEDRAVASGVDRENRYCRNWPCPNKIPRSRRLDAMYCSVKCNKKASRDRDPEHTKQLKAASYQRNKEHVRQKGRERYEANKVEISLRDRQARAAQRGIDLNNRRCKRCEEPLPVERTLKTKYCEACYVTVERERARVRAHWDYLQRPEEIKASVQVYAQSARGRAQRRAWLARNPTYIRDRKREAHRRKVGYNPEGRRCVDCSAEIAVTAGHNARFCPTCREGRFGPRALSCEVCGEEFSRKRARAPICGKPACRRIRRKAI